MVFFFLQIWYFFKKLNKIFGLLREVLFPLNNSPYTHKTTNFHLQPPTNSPAPPYETVPQDDARSLSQQLPHRGCYPYWIVVP